MNFSERNEEEFIFKFFKNSPTGFFIDVGANNGVKCSNSRSLFLAGWSGVCVEADPVTFDELQRTYFQQNRILCIHSAVWDRTGYVYFFRHLVHCSGNSTVHGEESPSMMKVEVPCMTLDDLVSKCQHPDFITIDTEGCDYGIISSYSFKVKPKLFMVEFGQSPDVFDSIFQCHGYKRVFLNESNVAYAL
jgi:FkbM family methyltransferase